MEQIILDFALAQFKSLQRVEHGAEIDLSGNHH